MGPAQVRPLIDGAADLDLDPVVGAPPGRPPAGCAGRGVYPGADPPRGNRGGNRREFGGQHPGPAETPSSGMSLRVNAGPVAGSVLEEAGSTKPPRQQRGVNVWPG